MPHHRQLDFDDYRARSGRGGRRPGAGRPPGPRPRVHHVRRPPVPRSAPAHITLRVRQGIPSLRSRRFVLEYVSEPDFREALDELVAVEAEERG